MADSTTMTPDKSCPNNRVLESVCASTADFEQAPASWFHLAGLEELERKPRKVELPGQSFVGFCTTPGEPVVISARCSHMSADLSRGCVRDGRLVCPLHGWEYGKTGMCERIPASGDIPAFARQASFPVAIRGRQVFFFNRSEARFPMPFFEGVAEERLFSARPFEFKVGAPWFLISGNGFDVQHFRNAHDRTLIGDPVFDSRDPFSFRMKARFRVTGKGRLDLLTRWISGSEVDMTVENWGGSLVLVTATFSRTTTHGLVSFLPQTDGSTLLRDIVWVRRSAGWIGRLMDRPNAAIRRYFIREFVKSDVERSAGIRHSPSRMIREDKALVQFLNWLNTIHR